MSKSKSSDKKGERMKDYTKALEGITYLEWQKLKHEIDLRFEIKKSQLLSKVELTLDCPNHKQSECE